MLDAPMVRLSQAELRFGGVNSPITFVPGLCVELFNALDLKDCDGGDRPDGQADLDIKVKKGNIAALLKQINLSDPPQKYFDETSLHERSALAKNEVTHFSEVLMNAAQIVELSSLNSALIIVDMQAEGCERHGAGIKPVIRNIRALLDRFREVNGNIIHVQSVRTKDHPEFTYFGKEYSLIEDTPAVEFVEELRPSPGEPVIKKHSHDCFYQTSMEEELKKFDLRPCRDHIIVTGIGSNNCVYHAVIGFHIRNYWIHAPEDCIHSSRPDGQQFAVTQFRSSAYNFNVGVTRSDRIKFTPGLKSTAVNS